MKPTIAEVHGEAESIRGCCLGAAGADLVAATTEVLEAHASDPDVGDFYGGTDNSTVVLLAHPAGVVVFEEDEDYSGHG